MKRWTIYCHTHIESGRRYVGVTSRTMERRWSDHCYAAKRNAKGGRWHFPNAIRKYGPDSFEHQVIRVFDNLEDANLAEKCLIKRWKTRDPKYGFNLSPGGSHVPHPIKNLWNNPEFRTKMTEISRRNIRFAHTPQARAANKATRETPESKSKRSAAAKKQWNNPQIRAKNISAVKASLNTPESKAKRSLSAKAQWLNPVTRATGLLATRAKWQNGKIREKLKDKWLDPNYREKCLTGPLHFNLIKSIEAAAKTICKNGHDLTGNNIYIIRRDGLEKTGLRVCATCERDRHARHVLNKRQAMIHCSNGHEFTPENTHIDWHGAKKCVICMSTCKNGHLKLGDNVYIDGKYERCLICVKNAWKKKKRRVRESIVT